jgi:hypothetical protein
MKSSQALKLARNFILYQNSYEYLCTILDYKIPDSKETAVRKNLREIFDHQYRNYGVLEWLKDMHGIIIKSYSTEATDYRLAWIDWMIEGYEAIGD